MSFVEDGYLDQILDPSYLEYERKVDRMPDGLIKGKDYPYPHCNAEVLHAPGECYYCDHYPSRQAYHAAAGKPFTLNEANGWSGNVAVKAGDIHTHLGGTFIVGDDGCDCHDRLRPGLHCSACDPLRAALAKADTDPNFRTWLGTLITTPPDGITPGARTVPTDQPPRRERLLGSLICPSCLRLRFSPVHWLAKFLGMH